MEQHTAAEVTGASNEGEVVVQKEVSHESGRAVGGCYSSNWTQLVLMSFVVFCCPGMFNALNSMGLGGDATVGNYVNAALYGTWMLTSFFAPAVVNILGAKWALMIGCVGYPVYALAMYYHARVYAILAGVLLGLTAGLLWTAQGQLMMSYPSKDNVGRFVAVFWGIFNTGGVFGTLLSFFLNMDASEEGPPKGGGSSLNAATYWTFFAIMLSGAVLALAVLPLNLVHRGGTPIKVSEDDGDRVQGLALVTRELKRTSSAFLHPIMVLFIPLFFYTNYFYEYHFGIIGQLFNGRTASLTSSLYWTAQILGSFVLQYFLDGKFMSLKKRMYLSYICIMLYLMGTWAFGGWIQFSYDLQKGDAGKQGLDFNGSLESPWPAMVCLFFWGFTDSFVQVWSYWIMSMITDVPEELACFTAFYKFWQNAGAFTSFLLGIKPGSFRFDYFSNVTLITIVLVPTLYGIRSLSSSLIKKADTQGVEINKAAV